jgi:GntR family transcriptional regulator, transcriptional repressor for pyruvate dehydrogenase complex
MAELRRRETLAAKLVQTRAARILGFPYLPGDKLPSELEMIEELGVSRTVMREAIATLKVNGLESTHQSVDIFAGFAAWQTACGV